tara:strand:- start:1574 stop:2872 length:1299 start_codon:yes stop_codon:yes gene_type:complete
MDGNEAQENQELPPRRDFLKRVLAAAGAGAVLDESVLGQVGTKPFVVPSSNSTIRIQTESDIGTLWPFVEKLSTRAYHPLAYTQPRFGRLDQWKQIVRAKVSDLLHYSPPRWPTKGRTLEKVDRGDYVLERVQFNTSPHFRVPGIVLVPKDAPRRETPAVIALHDHSGFYLWGKEKLVEDENENSVLREFKQRYYAGHSVATDLVRQGFLVVVIDLMYFGERRMILDDDPDDWRERGNDLPVGRVSAYNVRCSQYEALVSRTLMSAGLTWPGLIFWDDSRTVDYLLTRPEVDRSRIGAIGFSLGGIRAGYLGALDDRVKAVVCGGWMTSMPYQLKSDIKFSVGYTMLVPGLHRYLDYPDVLALNAPKPLLVMSGKQDGLFNSEGVSEGYQKLKKSYEKAGFADQLLLREFEAGHVLSEAMQSTAKRFLGDVL